MQKHMPSLDYFIIIADEQNVSHAAKRLNVTQQSLTSYLSRLEKHFETRLFDRGYRKMTLTAYGKQVYEAAVQIQRIQNRLYASRPQPERKEQALIRIGCMRPHAAAILKEIPIQEFRMEHESVQFMIHEERSSRLRQMLVDRETDLILVYEQPDLNPVEYCGVNLYQSDVFYMVSEQVLRKFFPALTEEDLESWKRRGIDLKAVRNVPVILPLDHSYVRRVVTEYLEKKDCAFTQVTECEDYSLMQYLAAANMGACLVSPPVRPLDASTLTSDGMYVFPIRHPNLRRTVMMYYRRENGEDYRFKDFVQIIKHSFLQK